MGAAAPAVELSCRVRGCRQLFPPPIGRLLPSSVWVVITRVSGGSRLTSEADGRLPASTRSSWQKGLMALGTRFRSQSQTIKVQGKTK